MPLKVVLQDASGADSRLQMPVPDAAILFDDAYMPAYSPIFMIAGRIQSK